MSRLIHVCQSVEGALRLWKNREWKSCAKFNKMTVEELKEYFWKMHGEGIKVIPIGEPCKGFDYKKGCPGHDKL